jgi:hypothetical protein
MTDRADILKTTINDFRYTYKVIDSEKKKKYIGRSERRAKKE